MSDFKEYAVRVDQMARTVFEDTRRADAALKEAEAEQNKYPLHGNDKVKGAQARDKYLKALDNSKAVQQGMIHTANQIAAVRTELVSAVNDKYCADPAQVDANTLELLKSGILNGGEYARLISKARGAGNHTMCRLIGKYAEKAADDMAKRYGQSDAKTIELRRIAKQGAMLDGNAQITRFDMLVDAFERCSRNHAMIPRWDMLTADIVENF